MSIRENSRSIIKTNLIIEELIYEVKKQRLTHNTGFILHFVNYRFGVPGEAKKNQENLSR
jgi:hypothetical protein